MIEKTVVGLDDQIANELKKPIEEEIKDVTRTVQNEITADFYRHKEIADYQYLLNKPNMTEVDKANMEKSIKFIINNKMCTGENLQKLDAIKYGSNYREIAGLKFSREKFIPEVQFNDKPNDDNVFESNEQGIYKTIYNGNPEYFLTTDQYIQQTNKQGKIAIEHDHISKAMRALPLGYSGSDRYIGANILGNILDLSMSGHVGDGTWSDKDYFGSLSSASPVNEDTTRAFNFHANKGILSDASNRGLARPCLSLIN